jgi:predicted MFS family arabinose efflux permease
MNEKAATPPRYSPTYVNYVLGVILLVMIFNIVDRTITSILLDDIKKELALSDRQLGILLGPAFAVVYTIASLPIAHWADHGVRRSIVALGLLAWSAATAATALVGNFGHLLAARMAVGIGEAAGSAPSQSMITDYVPAERRARALSVVSIGAIAGLAVGQIAGGWLGEWYGWRAAFVIVGLPGIAVAILVRFTVREPVRSGSPGSFFDALWYMLRLPSFRWILVCGSLALVASMGRNLWEPTFLRRVYGFDAATAGTWYFLIGPLPAALGIYLGARIGDQLGSRDARWYLWIAVIGQVIATPLQTAFVLWPEDQRLSLGGSLPAIPVGFLFSIVGAVTGSFFTAPLLAVTLTLVLPAMRAKAAAIATATHSLVGHGFGPYLVGEISGQLTPTYGVYALRYALLVATLMPLVSAAFFALAARTVRADVARAQAVA